MLIIEFMFPAAITGHSNTVSHPGAGVGSISPTLIILLCFLPVGETLCEIPIARTINDVWLIDLDPIRFIPMMIVRIIISLKEVARSRRCHPHLDIPNGLPMNLRDTRSPRTPDDIRSSEFRSEWYTDK